MRRFEVYFGFLHELEQVDLDAATGNILPSLRGCGSDLVDFVDVNDPMLSQLHVPVGHLDQVPHDVLDVVADVEKVAAADEAIIHLKAFDLPAQEKKLVIDTAGIVRLGEFLADSYLKK